MILLAADELPMTEVAVGWAAGLLGPREALCIVGCPVLLLGLFPGRSVDNFALEKAQACEKLRLRCLRSVLAAGVPSGQLSFTASCDRDHFARLAVQHVRLEHRKLILHLNPRLSSWLTADVKECIVKASLTPPILLDDRVLHRIDASEVFGF